MITEKLMNGGIVRLNFHPILITKKIIGCWYKKTSFNSKQKKEKQIQAQKQSTTMPKVVYNMVIEVI